MTKKRLVSGNQRGSAFVEACLVLLVVILPLLAFFLESIRLTQVLVLTHAVCFHFTRFEALAPSRQSRTKALGVLVGSLTGNAEKNFARRLRCESHERGQGMEGRVSSRFPALLGLFQDRYQVTKRCSFFYSR